jgi:hypothetical protein
MRDPSLMHTRIGLLISETCMTIAVAKLAAWSDHNIFDLTSSQFDSYLLFDIS